MITQKLADQLLEKVAIDEVRETIEKLCSIENKIAGTEAEKKASAYLKKRLSDYGLTNIKEESFDVHLWNPVSCILKVTDPVQKEIEAVVFPYSTSAKVKGPLIQFQSTSPEIHRRNNGMIGITNWGDLYLGPMRSYFHALDQEAKAAIITSPTEGDLNKIVIISAGGLLKIPVINVTKEDGNYLFKLLELGPVDVEIEIDVEYSESGTSSNLVATIEGTGETKEEIVVGAHFDAWFKGAADNSAPAAIVVELARLLNDYVNNGGELKRNLRFLLFGSEESGSHDFYYWCNGSKAYVNKHKDILENMVAMLSLDSIGYPAPAQNFIGATSDLFEFIKTVKTEIDGPVIEYYEPPGYGSDHWFFELSGVPSIYCVSFESQLYHTQKDDPEHLDYNAVQFHAEFMKETLIHLANSEGIPLNLFRPLATFQNILSGHTRWKDSPFDLSRLLSKISRILNRRRSFEKEVKRIFEKGTADEKIRVNQFSMSATRMMNQTIGWIWRVSPPDDINYLARLELITDYIDLNASIRALRKMPIANVGPHSAAKLKRQKENPYNWIKVHEPLAKLEEERSKIFQEVEGEISKLMKILDTISKGIADILHDK